MKRAGLQFLFFLIFALIYSFLVNFSYVEETIPNYSISISIPKREIFGAQKINVTFSIFGIGNFSFGSICVVSDATNIRVSPPT
jgi:hypothetical protein